MKRSAHTSRKRLLRAALVMVSMSLAAPSVLAQVAPGTATTQGEAPGAAPLAPMPAAATSTPTTPRGPETPAEARSTAFVSGRGECRDTVPGGNLLAGAYALTVLLLGFYVAMLARRNSKLTQTLEELELEMERRRGRGAEDSNA